MNPTPETDYCRDKAIPDGSAMYYASMYYPKEQHRKICALHALKHELMDICNSSDPGVAYIKFAWWKEELLRLAENEPRHPVTREFLDIPDLGLDKRLHGTMFQLTEFYESLINPESYKSIDDLLDYVLRGVQNYWEFVANVCVYYHPHTPDIVARLGSQYELFLIIQNRLLRRNINLDAFRNNSDANTHSYEYLVKFLQDGFQVYLQRLPRRDAYNQLHIIILTQIACATCQEMIAGGSQLEHELIHLTPLRKLWIAWRNYRKYKNTNYIR